MNPQTPQDIPSNVPANVQPPLNDSAAGLPATPQPVSPSDPIALPPDPALANPMPPAVQPPNPAGQASPPLPGSWMPQIADDTDLIEKEWVDKAKEIVAQTAHDPYLQNKEITKVKAEYMKKRYNKDLRLSD